ncbi:MAG: ribosomal RNA small subunit methyltransferase A [Methanobacteriota archaeon]|nr:MAG: ribosomal RNA small subunit methyltransferase A [Euryarchaeota archaeon]
MKELNLHPKQLRGKSGTHFLIRPSITARMVKESGITQQSEVLEIGGGFGILSMAILQHTRNLTIIEKNEKFIPILEEKAKGAEIILGDALKITWPSATHFISNLPYSVGSNILVRAMNQSFNSIVVMLQKEVVDRIVAKPGSKAYGRLSVITRFHGEPKKIMDVPPEAFIPEPKVHSSVLKIIPHEKRSIVTKDFELLAKNLFTLKNRTVRKVVRGYLKRNNEKEIWEQVPYKDMRVFQLDVPHLIDILEFLKSENAFPLAKGGKTK